MRDLGLSIALALSAPGAARAATGKESKGGSGPGAASGAGTSGGSASRPDTRDSGGDGPKRKVWEVEADWEFHHLFVQKDLVGAASNKNLNYFAAFARWEPTPDDRIALRGGLYQRFLADQGESGIRADDLILSYTHFFRLPQKVNLRTLVWLTAPTSFYDRFASIYTVPRVLLGVDHTFLHHITVDARVYGDYYIVKYASMAGGNPNPRAHLGMAAGVVVTMPFHDPLGIGLSIYNGYDWFYRVGAPPRSSTGTIAAADPRFTTPPPEQSYGGEIYIRYEFPNLGGFRSDATIAFANGDPTLGYASALHDGTRHLYGLWRQNAEFYATLTGRY